MTLTSASTSSLLEREQELAGIDAAARAALDGRGSVVLVRAVAGIGKTALLSAARREAESAGLTVLTASGGELERGFPFGIVRQLLGPRLLGVPEAERAELLSGAAAITAPLFEGTGAEAPDAGAVLHGLYWLVANLADRRPLMIVVDDDGHWVDLPSLETLLYLARRIEELPVLALVAARPAEGGEAQALVDRLAELAVTTEIVPNLATEGLSNRQIAQALFITIKTVENHLRNTYDKLEVGGKADLPAALGRG